MGFRVYYNEGNTMASIKIIETKIKDLLIIEPVIFSDSRGYFMETYNEAEFKKNGLPINFQQDNESKSKHGVLRGLHFQHNSPQGKLVRVVHGEVFDVAVDLRRDSITYGKWEGFYLNSDNRKMLYIPPGFAHGFLVISEDATFSYKCTTLYDPNSDSGIIYNDPDIGIEWPLGRISSLVVSEKDKHLSSFRTSDIKF